MPIRGLSVYNRIFLDPTSTFVYTLTDKSDRLSALLRLSSFVPQNNVEIFNINQLKDYTFPEDEQGLAMANVIVVDEVAIADLAQKTTRGIAEMGTRWGYITFRGY
ncbi:hypothetical protein OL548_10865 [Lysinibacillus sp. MHQ-1]|nr:hypothetical protein OL548_10865 [Lysinibacillus sp. MHQ-1]